MNIALRITRCLIIPILCAFLSVPGVAYAKEKPVSRVVMVCIDRMSVGDLAAAADLPHFRFFLEHGAVALLNTNTGGSRNSENAYATIGAGARALATGAGYTAFNANEVYNKAPAWEEFQWRTGLTAPEGSIVHLKISKLISDNDALPYPVQVGLIGDALNAEGLATCVLGNQDWEGEKRRQAVTIAMDSYGIVDYGDVGASTLRSNVEFPGGRCTDYNRLVNLFDRFYNHAAFTVIELGDWARLDEVAGEVLPEARETHRSRILAEMDRFLGELFRRLDLKQDMVILVSPTPPREGIKAGDFLTPVAFIGRGVLPGLAASPSTRRAGIILNTDLAPTVLTFLGCKPPENLAGSPVTFTLHKDGLDYLSSLNDQLVTRHNLRVPVIQTYMFFQIIIVLASVACIIGREFQLASRLRLRFLLLVTMSFPLACLLVSILPFRGAAVVVLETLALLFLVSGLAGMMRTGSPLFPLAFLSLATATIIIIDLMLGAPLQKHSMLGYDPLGGARFYGLGNEYMGVLVGAAIFGCGILLTLFWQQPERRHTFWVTGPIFALCLYSIAAPGVGANLGGAITAAFAFMVSLLGFAGVRFRPLVVVAVVASIPLVVGILAMTDLLRGAQQSHIGRAVSLILGGGGLPAALEIIQRKLAMNLKLIKYTIWSKVFMVSLGGLAILFYRPLGRMQSFRAKFPFLYTAFVAITVASIVALIFNDSGIVAAATTMVFGILPLLYLFLDPNI